MKNLFGRFLLSIFILVSSFCSISKAQDIIPVSIVPPPSILGCSDNIFQITMIVDSITHLSIKVVVMDSTVIADTSCSGISPVLVRLLNAPNAAISNESYNPLTSIWSCDIAPNDTVTFSLSIVVDCSVIQVDDNNQPLLSNVYFNQIWKGLGDDIFNINVSGSDTLSSDNIFTPFLVDVQTSPYTSSLGDTTHLLFTYQNNGIGADIRFLFEPDGVGNCTSYIEDSLLYGVFNPLGVGTYVPYSGIWQDVTLPAGHSIKIKRVVEITDCLAPCNDEESTFQWRCDYSAAADTIFCEDCQETFIHNYAIIEDFPELLLERLSPDSSTAASDFSCSGDSVNWVYRIRNVGPGTIPIARVKLSEFPGPGILTTLPINTLGISTAGCTGCSFDSTSTIKINTPFCGSNLLDSLVINIQALMENDFIDLSFSTIRCCVEDDPNLMNVEKYFNSWSIIATGTDSCGNGLITTFAAAPNQPFSGSNTFISGHTEAVEPDLDLNLEFIPTITHLTVPKDSIFGPSVDLQVTFQGLFPSIEDYQIVGCNLSPDCLMNGYLRARVYTDAGLNIQFLDSVFFTHDSLPNWEPEFFYSDKDSSVACEEGNYYFYFNLSDSVARTMLEEGDFWYTLQTCCVAAPVSQYSADFHLWANPDTCSSLVSSGNIFTAPTCVDCCWLPLSSAGHQIEVHCPGCKHPGIIVDAYKMERMNFGLEDSSNNQRADLPLAQIEMDSAYYVNHPLIRSNFSMHGDQLRDITVSHFEPGTAYTYQQMTNVNAVLKYLHLRRSIENSALMDLTVQDFDLYIDVKDTMGGCIDCNEVADTLYRTIQHNFIPSDSLSSYLSVSSVLDDNTYFYTFAVDSGLNTNLFRNVVFPTGPSTFNSFQEGQRYRLTVRYSVCGNYESEDENFRISDINDLMFLSGDQKLVTVADVIAPDSLPIPFDSTFALNYLFYCEKFGGVHIFCSNTITNSTSFANEGCMNTLIMSATTRIGARINTQDVFPFEFRTPAFKPVLFEANLPVGITLTGQTYSSINHAETFASLPLPFAVGPPASPNVYSFTDAVFSTPVCVTDTTTVAQPNTIYAFDEYTRITFLSSMNFLSCDPGYIVATDTIPYISFANNTGGCIAYSDTVCARDTIEKPNSLFGGSIQQPNPNLTLQIEEITVGTTQSQICWQYTFENPVLSPFTSAATNIYLLAPDSTDYSFLTNWTVFPQVGSPIFPDINGVFHIDDLLPTGIESAGSICASFVSCVADSIPLIWGWNCDGYPVPSDSLLTCDQDTTFVRYNLATGSFISPTKNHPLNVALCDTFEFGVTFIPADSGYIYPSSMQLTNSPNNLNFIGATLSSNTDTIVLLPPDANFWSITDSMMLLLGFPDFGLNAANFLTFNYTAIAACGYAGEDLPDHELIFVNFCGEEKESQADFNTTFNFDGTNCTDCFTIEKNAAVPFTFVNDTVDFQIIYCGNNVQDTLIAFLDQLPTGFNVTSIIPDSVTVPAVGCDTLIISGFYDQAGNCNDPLMINYAGLLYNQTFVVDDACMDVYPECAEFADVRVPDSSFASTYPGGIISSNWYLDGRFYIDVDTFKIQNSTVSVNAGGQIIVLPTNYLQVDSSLIQGCDFMWRGILAVNTSILSLKENTIIRDAEIAVFANDRSKHTISKSSIENCVRGFYVPPSSGTNNITQLITGSKFGLFGTGLKPGYPGQAAFGSFPRSGIELNDVILAIGSLVADSNYFYNMNNGIIGFRSNIRILNNRFDAIIKDSFYADAWDGSAIGSIGDQLQGKSGDLLVLPVNSLATTISNSDNGVYTDYSELNIDNVDMVDMHTGVYSIYCTNLLSSFVTNCKIETRKYGIHWNFNTGAKKMIADNNAIYATGTQSVGILLKESSVVSSSNYIVSSNYVELDGGESGIKGQSLLGAVIDQNIIGISNTPTNLMSGISISGNEYSRVSCNTIRGDDVVDTLKQGLRVEISNYSDISCNFTDSTGWGIFFGGICAQTSFKGNTMDDHREGLRLNNVAVIDTQTHAGNRWTGSYGNFGAVNMNAIPTTNVNLSRLDVNPTPIPTLITTFPTMIPNNSGWFNILSQGIAYSCTDLDVCDDSRHREYSQDLGMMIANDEILTTDFIIESQSISREYLYSELKTDSLLSANNDTLENFLNTNATESIGYLYEAKKGLRDSYEFSTSQIAILDSLIDQLKQVVDSINNLDSTQYLNTNIDYSVQREDQIIQYSLLQTSIATLFNQNQSYVTSKITSADFQNSLVEPVEIPEVNSKAINELDLLFRNGGKASISNNLFELQEIANQCPYKGGVAVYRARNLVALFNDSVLYDDNSVCAQQGFYRSGLENKSIEKTSLRLEPNPANEYVEIILSGIKNQKFEVTLMDGLGKTVLSTETNGTHNRLKVNTATFNPGVYAVEVNVNGDVFYDKLVIVR